MKKAILFFVVFSLFAVDNLLQAQQWHYYNPTAWFDVNAIEIPGPGIIAIGGGQETRDSVQIMFQSTDYGLTWNENTHDGLAPWNKSIAFSDSLNGYGVGYEGRIIKTDDSGLNWGWAVAPINRDLNKIIYAGAGIYYVAGGNKGNDSIQTILKSTDFGITWNVVYDTLGPWLKSIFFIDTLKGFAVGDNGVILATTDGGVTWSSIVAPVQRDFNAITFINGDTGFIVGGTLLGQYRRTILHTINGGANWSILLDTTGGILKDIFFADAIVGYTVGDSASILKTTDGGVNWQPTIIDTNLAGNVTFNTVKFFDRNFGVIGGKEGVIYIYQDPPVEVFTLGLGQIGTTNATLLGGINTHTKNARYSFVYSNTINFVSFVTTQDINVQSDSLLFISEQIQGLIPNTTYYYYLKAITVSDTIYGDTLILFTGTIPPFVFQTLDATGVWPWAANMNGYISRFPEPVTLFFEYGNSPAFGSQISGFPISVNDTMAHTIQVNITGLRLNNQYFFRLTGATSSRTYYGDTKMFYAVNLPSVSTGNATIISLTSVQLNGNVGNNGGFPTAIEFEYGLTTLYGNEVNAVPDSLIGTGNVNVSCLLTGLSPTSTYHYRVKAINAMGTSYGEDLTFIIGRPSASTYQPSNVGPSYAQLNGVVNANSFPTANKFEYGTTTSYGNEVIAIPDSATGNSDVNILYSLSGLLLNTTYHYRAKAINMLGTVYGNDMVFITANVLPTAFTFPASNIDTNSAQLNGTIIANDFPTENKFEYGTTTNYDNEVTAIPDSAMGYNNVNISYTLSGLLINTTYHYRAKAINELGVVYGNDVEFVTDNILPTISTQVATDITLNSAKLNAIVNPHHIATSIKFDYGLTTSYGNEINANPAYSSDSVDLDVNSDLSNLASNIFYHFRIKVITSTDTVFGNDMIFFTGRSEIPNFDFEMWDTTIIDFPDGWTQATGIITKYSPGCSGNYAIKIQNTPFGGMGMVTMGIFAEGISGGVPFNARPDSLVGCFNYNIDVNDTSWIGLLLKNENILISRKIFTIVGNSGGNFVNLKFQIPYETSEIPNSLIMFISSSNFNQKTYSPNSWIIADNIHFTGTSANIPNNSFEQWHNELGIDLAGWNYRGRGLIPPDTTGSSGVIRTTDAVLNNYAAKLKTFLRGGGIIPGSLYSGNDFIDKFPVNIRHQTFTGYYKFFPQNNDTMNISIYMYKNSIRIGGGCFLQENTVSSYTPFIVDINYSSSDFPDSALIIIQSFNRFPPLGSSVLYIDNLNFDGFLSAIKEPVLMDAGNCDFNVYPNPFNKYATVSFMLNQDEYVIVRLFDISGKEVALLSDGKYQTGNNKLDLSAENLQKGFYICVITTKSKNFSKKIIIQ